MIGPFGLMTDGTGGEEHDPFKQPKSLRGPIDIYINLVGGRSRYKIILKNVVDLGASSISTRKLFPSIISITMGRRLLNPSGPAGTTRPSMKA